MGIVASYVVILFVGFLICNQIYSEWSAVSQFKFTTTINSITSMCIGRQPISGLLRYKPIHYWSKCCKGVKQGIQLACIRCPNAQEISWSCSNFLSCTLSYNIFPFVNNLEIKNNHWTTKVPSYMYQFFIDSKMKNLITKSTVLLILRIVSIHLIWITKCIITARHRRIWQNRCLFTKDRSINLVPSHPLWLWNILTKSRPVNYTGLH